MQPEKERERETEAKIRSGYMGLMTLFVSFLEQCQPANVQSNDPCGGGSVVQWPAKSHPAAILPLG